MDFPRFDLPPVPLWAIAAAVAAFVLSLMRLARTRQGWSSFCSQLHRRNKTNNYLACKFTRDNGCLPPLNTVSYGLFGLGMVRDMLAAARKKTLCEFIRNWHHIYGTTFKAKMAGRNVIFTVEPRNVQTVLALKFQDFELGKIRNTALRPLLGHGIFCTDGSRWENSRALLRPNFVRNQIADIEVYENHVAKLIKLIPGDDSTVDLQPLFFRMTLDSATDFLFGESVHTLDEVTSHSAASFANNFNISQEGLAKRSRLGTLMMFYKDSRFSEAVREARSYVNRFVDKAINYRIQLDSTEVDVCEEARKISSQRYVFLHELSKRTLDKNELTDQLLNILLAGRDTTASLLSTTFFMLARRPDVWNKLQKEIKILNGEKPSFGDLKAMKYLTWVLNESLRMYPVVPINVRMANKNTYLPIGGGLDGKAPIFVKEGHEIMYSVYTMHRLPEIYGLDADEYRPERWESLKPGWAYAPFNGGPRICIGQQFALTEAGYAIARILQQFDRIENRDPNTFQEAYTLTLASANGTKVAMTSAKSS
ncbi:n-alkane-inducible cytochrome P450 [Penicillium lagena]|uniref:n-alkane-inducible cytochrome P450 n=1 Tax=Penicillium lagena TaxID=94218 RepID=UPI0025417375|nr:n-alkane-inducible cytochrome P450 [Penicillium lagena]KAJ5605217.1 n-alkane-inducible cytochrome P450 [Penicillium lagena]